MTTTIRSNGSKWAGQRPDPISATIERLGANVLCRDYNGFEPTAAGVRFWGNFVDLSAVFDIETDDPTIVRTLKRAIRANRQTSAYREQPHR